MSQPRRRRRRRRRGTGGGSDEAAAGQGSPSGQPDREGSAGAGSSRRRRRRRRGAARTAPEAPSPGSSADIFRPDRITPDVVGAPPDGRTLEAVIGDLQSEWGVPQHPQEYRITLKVSEERDVRGERVAAVEEVREEPRKSGQPRREKAPAAPRIGASAPSGDEQSAPAARRRRGRRRRRRGGGTAGSS
jgi:hypothetical protein